ncbi:MAG: penicillin-binding protein 2 [Hyphomonadaceae bacterium]|nr:penicillin-binding protein 2 [Hyphomonadaceae bacterium]
MRQEAAAPSPREERVVEAAPARLRVRNLAFALMAAFLLLAARAVQLAVSGDPAPPPRAVAATAIAPAARGDITDRNGVLMATNVRAYTLVAHPARVWDPAATARALQAQFPDLDLAAAERRLREKSRQVVYLRRGLTPRQRAETLARGLAGIGFVEEERRVYPGGELAGHVLGFADPDMKPLAGIERGLDGIIRRGPLRLTIDVRVQHAVEAELAAAARAVNAEGAAAIVLDGRTGDTLALASYPAFDPNRPGAFGPDARLNRAAASRFEMGSTLKSFTAAIALQERLVAPLEAFDLAAPMSVDGRAIQDPHPIEGAATLADIIAQSSNKGAATLALRIGPARQRAYFERLGLLQPARIELPESAAPIAPMRTDRLSVAILGYGHGLAVSVVSLAGAYTVFANDGQRTNPTLIARAPGENVAQTRVFSRETARATVRLLRGAVERGTGRRADVPGLEIAGKTGTAEKPGEAGYDENRMLSSFAAIFPASDPRYVVVLALDEPRRTAAASGLATGGAVAAPPVGRIAARIAPILGVRTAAAQ